MKREIVIFNVGGTRYDVAIDILMKFEDTLLAQMVVLKWNKSSQEPIYIERDGERFRYILDWYRDGRINVPKTDSIESIKSEALFFGLPRNIIIEESYSFDDFLESFDVVAYRSKKMKSNLKKIIVNSSVDSFAVWAIGQLLDNLTLIKGIPDGVKLDIEEYQRIQQFTVDKGNKAILLETIKKIIANIGNGLPSESLEIHFSLDKNHNYRYLKFTF
jgi:hypothetical protein